MAFNLFKKEKRAELRKEPEEKQKNKKEEKVQEVSSAVSFSGSDTSLILKGPHVTEKAGYLNGFNQYVFKVASRSNKIEVKRAVEKMYGVRVERVAIALMPAKKRRLGRQEGEKAGFKKAIIKLAEGQKIDIIPK